MNSSMVKLLLVDDHNVVRNGIRLMLSTADDFEITGEAATAQDALSLVRVHDFDVALVDIGLPDRSGLDLIHLLRDQKANLAVLILSMYSEEIYAVRALKQGAAGYLPKNCTAATMIAAIRKAKAGGKYVSPILMEKFADMLGGGGMASHEALSDRELEVLKLIASGQSLVRIAETLHLSPNTVSTYRMRILEKLGLKNNADLTRYVCDNGL